MPCRARYRAFERAGLVILSYRFYHKAALKASHLERGLNDGGVAQARFSRDTLGGLNLCLWLFRVLDQFRLFASHRFELGLLKGIVKVKGGTIGQDPCGLGVEATRAAGASRAAAPSLDLD